MDNAYPTAEHGLLREQWRASLRAKSSPHALAWETAGHTPREVLRKMGRAGMLGPMFDVRWHAARCLDEVLQTCQQVHVGMGYMRGTPIVRLWRAARILAIGGGATAVMLDEAAKRY
jgi:alkylation response protein AidB-like acyl-CoA dehydrogenase